MKGDSQPSKLRDSHLKPLSSVEVMVAHASVVSSKFKVELDSHADTCVVVDNCLVFHGHNRPVNVYSYDPKDGHRSVKTVDDTVGYQDLQRGQKFILMINQAICIDCLVNHLLCPMQCSLNGVYVSEVSKILAENPSETTHAKELVNPFDAAHPLIILLQLSRVTSVFDVYSPSKVEFEFDDIPNIHLTAEEPPWDPSTVEYSERETQILDH